MFRFQKNFFLMIVRIIVVRLHIHSAVSIECKRLRYFYFNIIKESATHVYSFGGYQARLHDQRRVTNL